MKLPRISTAHLVLVIGALGVVPLLFSKVVNDPARYPHLLGLLVVMGTSVALALRGKNAELGIVLPLWLARVLALWLGLHVLSMVRAVNLPEAVFETVFSLAMVAFFLLALHLVQREGGVWDWLGRVAIVSGAGQAVWGIGHHFGVHPLGLSYADMVAGTHANPNQFASACLLLVPLVVWGIYRLPLSWKIAGIASFLLLLAGMFFAGSRAVWLALLLWTAILPLAILPRVWRGSRMQFAWLAVGALVLIGGAYWAFSQVARQKVGSYNYHYLWDEEVVMGPEMNSLEYRFIVWNRTADMVADHPLLGVGVGNWKVRIPQYGIKGFDEFGNYGLDYAIRPHNEFLGTAAEMGLPGLVCWGGMLFAGWFWGIRRLVGGGGAEERIQGLLILLAFVGLTVVATFSFPRERTYQAMLSSLYLALAVGLPGNDAAVFHWHRSWKWGIGAVIAVALGITLVRIAGDIEMRALIEVKAGKKWSEVVKSAPTAGNWMINLEPVSAAPAAWYEGLGHLSLGQTAEGLAAMQRAQTIAPFHLAVRTNLAAAYEMNGQHVEAARTYHALLEVFPDFEESWLNLAVVYLNLGNANAVRYCLDRVGSFTTDPRFSAIKSELARRGQ
ncbi:MAG: O-antigen ligase family protein [Bacteroidota bacterium]